MGFMTPLLAKPSQPRFRRGCEGKIPLTSTTPASASGEQFGRVRGVFWVLLVLAIMLALAAPVSVYYQEATSALAARACLWPSIPRAGAPARLVIMLPPGRDSADTRGPWAQASAQWDMVAMEMGQRHAAVSGASAQNGAFVLPLTLNMAGVWRAQVSLQTPGRPLWRTAIQFATAPGAAQVRHEAIPSTQQLISLCQARKQSVSAQTPITAQHIGASNPTPALSFLKQSQGRSL